MIVNVNKMDNKVESINVQPTPLTYSIEVNENFNLIKTIEVVEGQKVKTNDNNQFLYKKPITITKTETIITGQEEVTEITDKPILHQIHKTNENNEPLYHYYLDDIHYEVTDEYDEIDIPNEKILMEDGTQKQLVITNEDDTTTSLPLYYIPVGFEMLETTEPTRTIREPLQPIMITVSKTDELGNPLYLKDIIETREITEESYIEVSYEKEAIDWENKEIPNMVLKDVEQEVINDIGETEIIVRQELVQEGTKLVQVEIDWVEYEPVMIPRYVEKQVNLIDNPTEFTAQEILEVKYSKLLEESDCTNLLCDAFINSDDLNLDNIQANTGVGVLQLLPFGFAMTKEIMLDTPVKVFKLLEFVADDGVSILVNDVTFVDGVVILPTSVTSVVIKFVNNVDRFKAVRSYAIGH